MAIVLLKKLIYQQYPIDLLTIIASLTLSNKYQDSQSKTIDYEFLAQCCQIQNIQLIHVSLSSSTHSLNIFNSVFHYRMLNFNFLIYFHMIFVLQHLIISFLIYQILLIMTTISNKLLKMLDLLYLLFHFHLKYLVS